VYLGYGYVTFDRLNELTKSYRETPQLRATCVTHYELGCNYS